MQYLQTQKTLTHYNIWTLLLGEKQQQQKKNSHGSFLKNHNLELNTSVKPNVVTLNLN